MSIGAMLGNIIESLFKKPATEQYPFERQATPERLRGNLFWDPAKCSGCQLCIRDCPSEALELIVLDKVNKRFVMRYHADRCTFCGQCVQTCRFKCLSMSNEQWELASRSREPFTVNYGKDEDVQFLLERAAKAGTGDPCPSE
jgi:formate hydrogenlyase subunit 6/NADH:ubiquinone oxidoreductase subunit I